MAWIADRLNRRTFDPVSNLELFLICGGSDGGTTWRIVGRDKDLEFHTYLNYYEQDDPDVGGLLTAAGVAEAAIWDVKGAFVGERQEMVAHALVATRGGHGAGHDMPYYVRFADGRIYGV